MEADHLSKLRVQFQWPMWGMRDYETVIGEGIFLPQDRRNGNHFALEMTLKWCDLEVEWWNTWSTAHSLQLSLVPVLLKSCGRKNVHMVSNKTGKQHLLLCFFSFCDCMLPTRQSTDLASSELYVCWGLDCPLGHWQLMLGDDELQWTILWLLVSKTGVGYYGFGGETLKQRHSLFSLGTTRSISAEMTPHLVF